MSTKEKVITYRELYELIDKKIDAVSHDLGEKIDKTQVQLIQQGNQLSSMQGQAKMIPFLISTAVSVFFFIIGSILNAGK